MKKLFIKVMLSLLVLCITACFDQKEQIKENNDIETYLQENNTKQETYENIISNTVQYGSNDKKEEVEEKEKRKNEVIISCQDCFHNVGFVEKVCEQNGTYYFERNKNEKDKYEMFDWYIYIFNERQKYKTIKEYNQPALTNEGQLDLKKGQYIYILCGYNPDTQVLPSTSDQTYTYYMK